MKYYDRLIFEMSTPGRIGYQLEKKDLPEVDLPKRVVTSNTSKFT
jgi:hypothetical protein